MKKEKEGKENIKKGKRLGKEREKSGGIYIKKGKKKQKRGEKEEEELAGYSDWSPFPSLEGACQMLFTILRCPPKLPLQSYFYYYYFFMSLGLCKISVLDIFLLLFL